MISNLVRILLLGKPVPATKPRLLGVIVEMVGRRKPIRGDLDLFLVQDYPLQIWPVSCSMQHYQAWCVLIYVQFLICTYSVQ